MIWLYIALVVAMWIAIFIAIHRSPTMPEFPKRVYCADGPLRGAIQQAPSLDARLWIGNRWYRRTRWGGPLPPDGKTEHWQGFYAVMPDDKTQSLRLEWFPLHNEPKADSIHAAPSHVPSTH